MDIVGSVEMEGRELMREESEANRTCDDDGTIWTTTSTNCKMVHVSEKRRSGFYMRTYLQMTSISYKKRKGKMGRVSSHWLGK